MKSYVSFGWFLVTMVIHCANSAVNFALFDTSKWCMPPETYANILHAVRESLFYFASSYHEYIAFVINECYRYWIVASTLLFSWGLARTVYRIVVKLAEYSGEIIYNFYVYPIVWCTTTIQTFVTQIGVVDQLIMLKNRYIFKQ